MSRHLPAPRGSGSVLLPAPLLVTTLAALITLSTTGCGSDEPTSEPASPTAIATPQGPDLAAGQRPTRAGSSGEPPPLEGDGLPQCSPYKDLEDVYGYCIYKFAGGFPSVAEVERLCSVSGKWEPECRHAWVAGRMHHESGFSTEDLLGACGSNPDCTFELLDFRPATDVLTQLYRCQRFTGKHSPDCAGHAMQRWAESKPDAEEIARVLARPTAFPNKVGFYAGAVIVCNKVGECSGEQAIVNECQKAVETFSRSLDKCPTVGKQPLNNSMNPGVMRPGRAPRQQGRPAAQGGPGAPNPVGAPGPVNQRGGR